MKHKARFLPTRTKFCPDCRRQIPWSRRRKFVHLDEEEYTRFHTARGILQARRESIDVGRIGLFSGLYNGTTMQEFPGDDAPSVAEMEDMVSRYAVAQSLIDNIGGSDSGLVVREVQDIPGISNGPYPILDLEAGNRIRVEPLESFGNYTVMSNITPIKGDPLNLTYDISLG